MKRGNYMLTYTEIIDLDNEVFTQFSNDNELEDLFKPILIKYPDYYYLRGEDIRNISSSEKENVIEILQLEFS